MKRRSLLLVLGLSVSLTAAYDGTAQGVTPVRPPGGGDPHFGVPIDALVDKLGNRVPDFSYAGYMANAKAIPAAPVRLVVPPVDGDDGARIQAALDQVAALQPDEDGVRGAVLLEAGTYQVEGQLVLKHSGVVLRGQGPGPDGTAIEATGFGRRPLIRILGSNDRQLRGSAMAIESYVPVGSFEVAVSGSPSVDVGDRVLVTRPSTAEWIEAAGMRKTWQAPKAVTAWRPGELDLAWDRWVTAVEGNTVTLSAPLTMALDPKWGGGTIQTYAWPGRIEQVGVENLRLVSVSNPQFPKDEDHSWTGVSIENARNAWVRQMTFEGFSGSAVSVWETVSCVTVSDCKSLAPVSEDGGWRRHTFFTQGQQTLFLRCYSEHGRHDFSTGHAPPGPNAFVHCDAREALHDSGPIGPWATGVLYDNVNIDGDGLRLGYRGSQLQFVAWTAANCMAWQCTAAEIDCYRPPTAQNWAFGCWAIFEGDGVWDQFNEFVSPKSLLRGQLEVRLGEAAGERIGNGVVHPPGSTRPSVEKAQQMVATSSGPAPQLTEVIDRWIAEHPLPTDGSGAAVLDPASVPAASDAPASLPLKLENGWLTIGGELAVGGRMGGGPWWRGSVAPPRVGSGRGGQIALTRFVPSRTGTGYTDDLDEIAEQMASRGTLAVEHHPPLWYDRRRDDHERVRRIDGEVWPPFYEMPYARSGQETAWDGLSKYDLTRPNRWYFDRLDGFAQLCQQMGLVLIEQHYFQHNILEAGAHWADYPWRSANNINNPGFPEPPPYAGDKRIFQAHLFYDIDNPARAALHKRTVRMYLDELHDRANVIHLLGAEYTGPLHFTQFWIKTIGEWERETGHDVLAGLSTTREEQDAILNDPELSTLVDIIDTRYWGLRAGINLSPRQQGRRGSGGRVSTESVREYRLKFPDKAVMVSSGGSSGWDLVMAGGSLPSSLPGASRELLAAIPQMQPANLVDGNDRAACLAEPGRQYLVTSSGGSTFDLDMSEAAGEFEVRWLSPNRRDPSTAVSQSVRGDKKVSFTAPGSGDMMLWLTKIEP